MLIIIKKNFLNIIIILFIYITVDVNGIINIIILILLQSQLKIKKLIHFALQLSIKKTILQVSFMEFKSFQKYYQNI